MQPGRTARTAWLIAGAVMLAASLAWGTYEVFGLVAHEEYTVVDRFAATEIAAVEVHNDDGAVSVIGREDLDEIVVTAKVTESLRSPSRAVDRLGDRLVLGGDCPAFSGQWCSVDYTIEVPRDRAIEVHSSNGRVEVRGIDGDTVVSADNGRVEVTDMGGSLELSSDNGRVTGEALRSTRVLAHSDNGRVQLEFVVEPVEVVAESDNGRVEVVVPQTDAAYRLDMDSDNGDVNEEVRADPTSDRSITAISDNGSVTVRYPETR